MATTSSTIIEKNIATIKQINEIQVDSVQSACNVIQKINDFEGWGRCRALIDTSSDEYKNAWNSLHEVYSGDFTGTCIESAQSATLTSFYTPKDIATTITIFCLRAYRKTTNREPMKFLDPSAGTGAFIDALNGSNIKVATCEKDLLTHQLLSQKCKAYNFIGSSKDLFSHPEYCYQNVPLSNRFDIIASNIPFGTTKVVDTNLNDLIKIGKTAVVDTSFVKDSMKTIHNYYFIKSVFLLKEDGILAFITSRGFLSSDSNKKYRDAMLSVGRIISIVRLPDNMFPTIEVGSDLIVYQRTKKKGCQKLQELFSNGWKEEETYTYCVTPNCATSVKKNQYGKPCYYYKYNGDSTELSIELLSPLYEHLQITLNNMTTTTKPIIKPTVARIIKPVVATKATTAIAKPVIIKPTVARIIKPIVAVAKPKKSDWREELYALANMYAGVNDDNRSNFLTAYKVVTEGSGKSLHELVSEYGNAINVNTANALLTLEQKDKDGKWIAADIFYKAVEKIDINADNDAHAALAASLNKYGKVDMPYMQIVSKLTRDELISNLESQLFFNPITGCYEEADRWLTGDVVAKIKQAKEALSNYKNGELLDAERAISALEAARPSMIPFEDIDVQFGARWVPTEYYEDFIYHVAGGMKRSDDKYEQVKIAYSAVNDDYIGSAMIHKSEWRMRGHDTEEAIFWALKGATPKFMTEDKDGKKVRDEEKYQRAQRIIQQIQQAWLDYINLPKSYHIRENIEKIYNDRFNGEVRPKYDGTFQTFPDLHLENLGITELYQSQKDCIWMLKRNGGGVAWHEVGTGKTLIMCIAAYEMKRIGLCNKPLIIGLKANIGQIADTFRKAYPNAKILFPSNADFSEANRIDLFNQIKNNDWDCVIMTHDQFGRIPSAEQMELKMMQERINGLNDVLETFEGNGRFRGRKLSGLQKRKENLMAKLEVKRIEIQRNRDKVGDFHDMGIDHILVDESHYFKNLPFETRNDRVAGIGNPEGSQRAEKLRIAIRDIQERTGRDLGATFLSGTIVSNSLTELYTIFNYLRPNALAAQNIHSFDAWAAVFCERKIDYEPNVVGQVVSKERFASYVNLPELSKFLSQITDYRTSTMCGIDAPNIEQHFVASPPTPQQEEMLGKLVDFVNSGNWSTLGINREAPKNLDKSLMLVATNVARQTALDPRMLDDCKTYGDEDGNKVRRCAQNVYDIYTATNADKGTQFVFNDISTYDNTKWNMQQELHDLLVNEYAIPSDEIAFINEATCDSSRLSLFKAMNEGKVRVLIGSTTKLGTGVNAQERAVAIHHLDIPWRPSDLEQRNGRAVRKGNWLAKQNGNKVDVYIYATERTLDAYKFSLLKNKQMFIDQLNNGTLGMRRIDESILADGDKAVSYAEFLSIVSGNTELLEKTRIDAKIMALEKDRQAFYRQRNQATRDIEQHEKDISTLTEWICLAKSDLEKHTDITEKTIPVIQSEQFAELKDAGKKLYDIIDSYKREDFTTFGKCGSLRLSVCHHGDSNFFYIIGNSGQYYKCICRGNTTGILGKVGHESVAHYPYETLSAIPSQIEQNEKRIEKMKEALPDLRSFEKKEWNGIDELAELKHKQQELAEKIDGKQKKEFVE